MNTNSASKKAISIVHVISISLLVSCLFPHTFQLISSAESQSVVYKHKLPDIVVDPLIS